jgi:chromosome partitioning protein
LPAYRQTGEKGVAMATKIAFINSKGGCGKTTSIFHVSGVLSKLNKKVLVIDLDKQKNTTSTLMMNVNKKDFPKKTVFDFLQGKATPDESTGKALFQRRGNANPKYYGVDCMVADSRLENETLLKKADGKNINIELDKFIKQKSYDWILVDMPPSNATLNHICFAYIVNFVVIPFSSDMFSLDGYDNIAKTIKNVRNINESLISLGVYLARYMGNCALDNYIKNELSERLSNKNLNTNDFIDVQIPLAADIREAVFYGRPISYYKEFSNSCKAYERLVHEIIKRVKSIR